MTGMSDPFNRATYPWGAENEAVFVPYTALLTARRGNGALKRGLCRMGALSPEVYAIFRWLPETGECAAMLVNRAEREQTVSLRPGDLVQGPDGEGEAPLSQTMTDVITKETIGTDHGELHVTLPPLTARLYTGTTNV